MSSELIINATLPETRIALLEGGEIQELLIERESSRGIVGNIYKGRVVRVLPGMQAAFVDIGQEKAAFLYVDDVFFPEMDKPLRMPGGGGVPASEDGDTDADVAVHAEEGATVAAGSAPDAAAASTASATEASVVLPDEMDEALPVAEEDEEEDEVRVLSKRRKSNEGANIQDLVKEGQDIVVQVVKDPIGTKGARLSCHVSLPGRYLVFMPTVDHVGVSRRIESDSERRRLKESIQRHRPPQTGFIVRTASSTQDDNKIRDDIDFLVRAWNDVCEKYCKSKAPTVLHQDHTMVIRAIRDMVTDDVERLVVDSRSEHKQIQKFVSRFMPHMKTKVELYEKSTPIFDYFGIEIEIQRALDRKVWLKSGGYLMVDQSEALVAIDVNTGRYVGKKNLEDTILKTNLEAVKEIAYQLRLRNCGGIIILDLIDMEKESNREKVYQALEEALKKDRARPTILKISQLGLVEMTRKRTRDSTVRTLCEPCPYCEGKGYIKNKLTMAYDILRAIEREGAIKETSIITVECAPTVAEVLAGDKGDILTDVENRYGKKVVVKANSSYHLEQFEVVATRNEKAFMVKEIRRDARGLGDTRSVTDELEERGTVRSRLRQKEWEDSVQAGYNEEEIEEVLSTLPFIDEEKRSVDGDRDVRDERDNDRGRRRGRRMPKKERDKGRSKDKKPHHKAREAVATDRDDDTDSGDQDTEHSSVPTGRGPISAKGNPRNVDHNDDADGDYDDSDSGGDNEDGYQGGNRDGQGQGAPSVDAASKGPRNYEEYIKTAPEAGTELTRAEWETMNSARGGRPGGGPGGHPRGGRMHGRGGDKRNFHKRRRGGRRRNGGGGNGGGGNGGGGGRRPGGPHPQA